MLRTIATVIFIVLCIALVILVMLQESKNTGLTGTVSGMADTYWGKNKGRSMEGALEHFTRYGAIVFMILTLVLNILMKTQG